MVFFRKARSQAVDAVSGAISDAASYVTEGQAAELKGMQKMTNTLKALFGIFAIMILISAAIYSFTEKDRTFFDGVWYAVVTATTTGYGDQYPVTVAGRVGGMMLMVLMGFFITPIITAKWAARAIVDSDAWTHQEQEELKQRLLKCVEEGQSSHVKLDLIMAHLGLSLPDSTDSTNAN